MCYNLEEFKNCVT